MKKALTIVFAAILALSLAACGTKEEAEPETVTRSMEYAVNPVRDMDSLEDVNRVVGTAIKRPAGEVSKESFSVIDGQIMIAQYDFFRGAVAYCLRAAESKEDISGYYVEGGSLGEVYAKTELEKPVSTGDGLWFRWFEGDVQYSLLATGGVKEADFMAIVDSVR